MENPSQYQIVPIDSRDLPLLILSAPATKNPPMPTLFISIDVESKQIEYVCIAKFEQE